MRLKSRSAARPRRVALGLASVIAGVGLLTILPGKRLPGFEHAVSWLPTREEAARFVGLGLDQVAVTGQRYTKDSDIFNALDLDHARLLVGFDSKAARERIEALPWVASVELTRVYPGRMHVRISERTAFAVWSRAQAESLIDKTGRVLQDVAPGHITHLPHISGENANTEAASFMVMVSSYPELAAAFETAERVDGRRWAIRLNNGSRIDLPADGGSLALAELEKSGRLAPVVHGEPVIVDLRAPGRIAIRPADKNVRPAAKTVAGIGSLIEAIERGEQTP